MFQFWTSVGSSAEEMLFEDFLVDTFLRHEASLLSGQFDNFLISVLADFRCVNSVGAIWVNCAKVVSGPISFFFYEISKLLKMLTSQGLQ